MQGPPGVLERHVLRNEGAFLPLVSIATAVLARAVVAGGPCLVTFDATSPALSGQPAHAQQRGTYLQLRQSVRDLGFHLRDADFDLMGVSMLASSCDPIRTCTLESILWPRDRRVGPSGRPCEVGNKGAYA